MIKQRLVDFFQALEVMNLELGISKFLVLLAVKFVVILGLIWKIKYE